MLLRWQEYGQGDRNSLSRSILFFKNQNWADVLDAVVGFGHKSFFEMHKNGNNANIGIRGFISWKQKKISYKMLP